MQQIAYVNLYNLAFLVPLRHGEREIVRVQLGDVEGGEDVVKKLKRRERERVVYKREIGIYNFI